MRVVRLSLQEGLHGCLVYAAIPAAVLLLILLPAVCAAVLGLAIAWSMGTCCCCHILFIFCMLPASNTGMTMSSVQGMTGWQLGLAGLCCRSCQ